MGYKLASFDGLTLPLGNADWNNDTATSVSRMQPLPNGLAFDGFGAARAYRKLPYQITYRAEVMGYSTIALTRAAVDALKAKRGVRGTLTRTDDAGSSHTCTARCIQVRSQGGVTRSIMAPNVEMVFEILTPWKGTAHTETWYYGNQYTSEVDVTGSTDTPAPGDNFIEGGAGGSFGIVISFTAGAPNTGTMQYLVQSGTPPALNDVMAANGGPDWTATITSNPPSASTTLYAFIPQNGNAPCRDMVLTVTEGGTATVTAVGAGSSETDWRWLLTRAMVTFAVIDCGARTATSGTFPDYESFALDADDHQIEDWAVLMPGVNTVAMYATGGDENTSFAFAYNDTWE